MTTPSTRPSPYPDESHDPQGTVPAAVFCGAEVTDRYWQGSLASRPGWPCCMVHEAWYEYHQEIEADLHWRYVDGDVEMVPAVLSEPEGRKIPEVDSGELGGRPYSVAFRRRLGYRFTPADYIVIDSEMRGIAPVTWALEGPLRRKCRGKHAQWADHRGRPVCYEITRLVIVEGWHLSRAALELDLTPERGMEHLERALRNMWSWRSQWLNNIDLRRSRFAA